MHNFIVAIISSSYMTKKQSSGYLCDKYKRKSYTCSVYNVKND